MEEVRSFEIMDHRATRCYIPEDIFRGHRCENLKFNIPRLHFKNQPVS
jgi:hypothetical protein